MPLIHLSITGLIDLMKIKNSVLKLIFMGMKSF